MRMNLLKVMKYQIPRSSWWSIVPRHHYSPMHAPRMESQFAAAGVYLNPGQITSKSPPEDQPGAHVLATSNSYKLFSQPTTF